MIFYVSTEKGEIQLSSNLLAFNSNSIILNGEQISIDQIYFKTNTDYFDLALLLNTFRKHMKQGKIKSNFIFKIQENEQNIHIEFINRDSDVVLVIDPFFLSTIFDEYDIIAYLLHELGHLIDPLSSINYPKRYRKLQVINLLFFIAGIGAIFYLNLNPLLYILSILAPINIFLLSRLLVYRQRECEYRADRFSLKFSKDRVLFKQALNKLSAIMSMDHESKTHPSLNNRIKKIDNLGWIYRIINFID